MATSDRFSKAVDVTYDHQQNAEDEIDAAIVRKRLAEIERDPEQLVRGEELADELADILE